MSPNPYTEDHLVEQPAIELFAALGWQTVAALEEPVGPDGTLGRETRGEVVLVDRLRAALVKFNPTLPPAAIDTAIDELTRDRAAMSLEAANREIYRLLKEGIPVSVPDHEHGGQKRTRNVFGDYVSIYDFQQSVKDGATVPLFYENRTPELQLVNPDLNADLYRLIEDAGLDDAQEAKLEQVLGRQYHLITRDDRLETVAQDIVRHFLGRGFVGKAIVVSIDKATSLWEKVGAGA